MSYFPVTPNRSGEILAAGQMQAANTQAQMYNQLGSNIGNALASVGGAIGTSIKENKAAKNEFDGTYRFLSSRGMLSPDTDAAIQGLVKKKDFAGANAIIAPLLAELDFGRRSMLAGRSGFFDSSGQWQMAMPAQATKPTVTF